MFGLEGHKKKKKVEEFVFDLEMELKDPQKRMSIKKDVEGKVQQIKNMLRGGGNKADFDQLGVLLHGYTSLLRVIGRFGAK